MICAVFDSKSYDRQFLSAADTEKGIEFRFLDFRLSAQTRSAAAGAQAVCVFVNDTLDREGLEALKAMGVRHVALRSAGFNNVDIVAARELGIPVTRVPAYSPYAVAEYAVALLLTLNRKTHRAFNRVREQNFSLSGLIGFDVHGKTVGIVGTGKIGRITAEIFRGFGCRLLVEDVAPDQAWAQSIGATYTKLDDLLRQSDIVSLHVPLFPSTYHLLNQATLARMKRGAYLINTSRGKLIDTAALIAALKDGHLGGVALDVYEEEEGIFFEDYSGVVLQDDELSRLLTFPNVLVTSHQAFFTVEALEEISRVTVENLVRIASGQTPLDGTQL